MRIKGAMTILKKRAEFYGMTTEQLVQWLDNRNDETIKVLQAYEVYKMDIISSESRALGTLMLLVIAAASMPLMTETHADEGLFKAGIIWDLVFLIAPVAVHAIITKRGLDRDVLNRGADQVMLGGLLVLGMFDQSGGLLFLTMYGLVALTAFKYRHHVVSCIALSHSSQCFGSTTMAWRTIFLMDFYPILNNQLSQTFCGLAK